MKKITVSLIAILIISMLAAQVVALASGCGGEEGGSGSGGCSGGMLGTFDKANTYGIADTHAFHNVRGISVLNMTEGNGNVVSAEAIIAAVGINQLEQTNLTVPAGSREVNNGNALRKYNRIAAHAFHTVKGISMINMTAGNGNVVQSSTTVNATDGFMEQTDVFFDYVPED